MMEIGTKCSCGIVLNEDCHLAHFTSDKSLYNLTNFSENEVKILKLRIIGVNEQKTDVSIETICSHHRAKYLNYYSSKQIKCCDPWVRHSSVIKSDLREITLEVAVKSEIGFKLYLIPGKKLCKNCYKSLGDKFNEYNNEYNCCVDPYSRHRIKVVDELEILKLEFVDYLNSIKNVKCNSQHKICNPCKLKVESDLLEHLATKREQKYASNQSRSQDCADIKVESQSTESSQGSYFQSASQKKRKLEEILNSCDLPPFKRSKLSNDRLKIKAIEAIDSVVNKVSTLFEETHEIQLPKLKSLTEMRKESFWFNDIVKTINFNFNNEKNFNNKVRLLSTLPENMTFKVVSEYVPNCTYHMWIESKKLKQNIGILSQRIRKSYIRVSPEIRDEIVKYYLDESHTIPCSGMKECVKIKVPGEESISLQKKILIYDLKDLYQKWIKDCGHEKVPCLAFFTQLKPKQCVFADTPGTHNVCVCSMHQNVKLKLAAVEPYIHYKDAIKAGVCSVDNNDCVLNKCEQCPKEAGIRQFLCSALNVENIENVEYSNWNSVKCKDSDNSTSTRVSLIDYSEPIENFLDHLSNDIWNMTEHHFVASKQKAYLDQCKTNLTSDTGILIMDFAENYSYLCQNSTQGFYFSNYHASLFTAALYYKEEGSDELKVATYCIISDNTKHQAFSVNLYMEKVIDLIKNEFPWITSLIEWSDGAPTQFKNKNHFSNLLYHAKEFGIKIISYNFFATSHGKSICDGVGGTAKRIARKASKQGIKITTAKELFDYLSHHDSNVRYLYVNGEEIVARGKKLLKRFANATGIPATRTYHSFTPIDEKSMRVKVCALDEWSKVFQVNE